MHKVNDLSNSTHAQSVSLNIDSLVVWNRLKLIPHDTDKQNQQMQLSMCQLLQGLLSQKSGYKIGRIPPPFPLEQDPLNAVMGSGEHCELPEQGLGGTRPPNTFWLILS